MVEVDTSTCERHIDAKPACTLHTCVSHPFNFHFLVYIGGGETSARHSAGANAVRTCGICMAFVGDVHISCSDRCPLGYMMESLLLALRGWRRRGWCDKLLRGDWQYTCRACSRKAPCILLQIDPQFDLDSAAPGRSHTPLSRSPRPRPVLRRP